MPGVADVTRLSCVGTVPGAGACRRACDGHHCPVFAGVSWSPSSATTACRYEASGDGMAESAMISARLVVRSRPVCSSSDVVSSRTPYPCGLSSSRTIR